MGWPVLGRLKSRQQRREVRLRGLWGQSRVWRRGFARPPIQERMNSPLDKHEVRLRGLRRRVWRGTIVGGGGGF
ncbi:hypothetical protein FHS01_001300 [Longimicrobium terrae]|nr:hypothetical protein [Longimicrobium terrae]